jgi:hypothetical protein
MLYVHQIILGLEKYDLLQEEKKKTSPFEFNPLTLYLSLAMDSEEETTLHTTQAFSESYGQTWP